MKPLKIKVEKMILKMHENLKNLTIPFRVSSVSLLYQASHYKRPYQLLKTLKDIKTSSKAPITYCFAAIILIRAKTPNTGPENNITNTITSNKFRLYSSPISLSNSNSKFQVVQHNKKLFSTLVLILR